jgi:hypothetical protein
MQLQQLATNVFQVAELERKIEAKAGLLGAAMDRQERQKFEVEVERLKSGIAARHENVLQQIGSWSREQVRFAQGTVVLTNWVPVRLGNKGHLNQGKDEQGKAMLTIEAEAGTVAAWKTRVLLPRGRYRFSGIARTHDVKTLRAAKNPGARLRVPGHIPDRTGSLAGTQAWKPLELGFDVVESEQLVEVLCELSADQGEAAFRLDSLQLEQVP